MTTVNQEIFQRQATELDVISIFGLESSQDVNQTLKFQKVIFGPKIIGMNKECYLGGDFSGCNFSETVLLNTFILTTDVEKKEAAAAAAIANGAVSLATSLLSTFKASHANQRSRKSQKQYGDAVREHLLLLHETADNLNKNLHNAIFTIDDAIRKINTITSQNNELSQDKEIYLKGLIEASLYNIKHIPVHTEKTCRDLRNNITEVMGKYDKIFSQEININPPRYSNLVEHYKEHILPKKSQNLNVPPSSTGAASENSPQTQARHPEQPSPAEDLTEAAKSDDEDDKDKTKGHDQSRRGSGDNVEETTTTAPDQQSQSPHTKEQDATTLPDGDTAETRGPVTATPNAARAVASSASSTEKDDSTPTSESSETALKSKAPDGAKPETITPERDKSDAVGSSPASKVAEATSPGPAGGNNGNGKKGGKGKKK